MAKIGRKTKRTPSLQDKVLEALRIGHTDGDACSLSGISQSTFYEWIKTIPEFSEKVEQARLKAKDTCIKVVRRAALTNWAAATWWLTRRGGKEFKADSELPPINVNIENQVLTPELESSLNQAIKYALPKNYSAPDKSRGPTKKDR